MRLWAALLLLPTLAAAEPFPSCVRKTAKNGYREPASLQALLDCQQKKLDSFIADYAAKQDDDPSDETVERWRELQRGEVRDFIKRHPERSVVEGPDGPGEPSGKKGGTQSADLKALQQELWEKSDGGEKGITPEMAQLIVKKILDQQGYMSKEMTDLLNSVQKDGANLSDGTVRQLKEAARQADTDGLDLGVQPDVKEFLLKRN